MVTSIGSDAWDRLFSGPRPAQLHPFTELQGTATTLPPHRVTLLFHLRAESLDFCFELATQVLAAMGGAVTVVDEVHGFRFFDNRDLLGFVDGTENPEGRRVRAPPRSAREDPASPGLLCARPEVRARMAAWQALSVPEQERVIGRTKLEDIELADDVNRPTRMSH